MTDTRYVILLQGNEYAPEKGIPFREKCDNLVTDRIRHLESHKKDAVLPHGLTLPATIVFLRLDVPLGVVQQFAYVLKSGPRATFRMTKRAWKPADITAKNEVFSIATERRALLASEYRMVDGDEHPQFFLDKTRTALPISITDAYQCVRQAPAGSVIELSIFSHAYHQGPIITNSSDTVNHFADDPHKVTKLRDPADFDGRFFVDFNSNMGVTPLVPGAGTPDHLSQFKSAFAADAEIRVWGCNGSKEIERLVGMYKQLQKMKLKKETIADTTVLKYKVVQDMIDPKTGATVIDPKTGLPKTEEVTKKTSLGAYRARIGRKIRNTYAYNCANHTGVTTYGMFPAISSDNSGDELMVIDKSHKLTLSFYKNYMNLRSDERGYGLFNAAELQKIKDLEKLLPADKQKPV
jgi:hypothetical protein